MRQGSGPVLHRFILHALIGPINPPIIRSSEMNPEMDKTSKADRQPVAPSVGEVCYAIEESSHLNSGNRCKGLIITEPVSGMKSEDHADLGSRHYLQCRAME